MIRWACLIACVAAVSCAAPLPGRPTLCQVATAQQDYVGRELTVEGYLLLSFHGNAIVDPGCRGAGVDIRWQSDRPQLRAFISARQIGSIESWVVRVRATGVLVRGEEIGEYAPRFSLRLNTAEVLDAWKVPEAEEERFGMWMQGAGPPPVRPSR
jgi:hypothetical protein